MTVALTAAGVLALAGVTGLALAAIALSIGATP